MSNVGIGETPKESDNMKKDKDTPSFKIADSEKYIVTNSDSMPSLLVKPHTEIPPAIIFHTAEEPYEEYGRFFVKDGKVHFEGDLAESGEIFIRYLRNTFPEFATKEDK